MSQADEDVEYPVVADRTTVARLLNRLAEDRAGTAAYARSLGLDAPDDRPDWTVGEDFDPDGNVRGLVWYFPVEVREPESVPLQVDPRIEARLWAFNSEQGTVRLTEFARSLGLRPPEGRADWEIAIIIPDGGEPGLYWSEPDPGPSGRIG